MAQGTVPRVIRSKISSCIFKASSSVIRYLDRWWEDHKITKAKNIENLHLGEGTIMHRLPYIRIHKDAKIIVGDNVLLNSSQEWCLVSAYSPITLLATHAGAQIVIGNRTRIHASCIRAYSSVSIGTRCLIASNCQIMDASGHSLSFPDVERRISDVVLDSKPVVIEDDVWLCEGVKVLPGVTIGKGTVVGAGSVVTKSLPAFCMAAGIPAKVIKTFK